MTDQPAERPTAQRPDVPPEPTGVAEVDEVLRALDAVQSTPTAQHVAIYETVHQRLHGVLTEFDDDASSTASP